MSRFDKAFTFQNQRALTAHLERVRSYLEAALANDARTARDGVRLDVDPELEIRSALAQLCNTFALSEFERDILVLCAGIELDSAFAVLCARANGDSQRNYATFSIALAALPNAHWSALTPDAALRKWQLIEVQNAGTVTSSPLRINENVLHFLAGTPYPDKAFADLILPVPPQPDLVRGQRGAMERIVAIWKLQVPQELALIQLVGSEAASKRAVAFAAANTVGLDLYEMDARQLPGDPSEFTRVQRAWERHAALFGCALLVNAHELDAQNVLSAQTLARWVEQTQGALILASETRHPLTRPGILLDVKKPSASEQFAIWQGALGDRAAQLDGALERLVSQFDLNADAIQSAAAEALGQDPQASERALWDACRAQARPRLDDLAQRIEAGALWDDIVLPQSQIEILHEIAMHVRRRQRVYETWGWTKKQTRGLGISALFAGASGTGKTMAGEVLANELHLDLYRIDLSAVVSKYIGETERNLKRVFDAAEAGGAILLFDEADALFGKRTQVQDSHDRYANIEISYLLQRMEQYRGLAILTTNMLDALDKAFLRRIRFVVNFPFPDFASRREIWERVFPHETPQRAVDAARLARLNIAGGNIRNIALNASFLAADADEPVQMHHLMRAAQSEYDKLGKRLTDNEIKEMIIAGK